MEITKSNQLSKQKLSHEMESLKAQNQRQHALLEAQSKQIETLKDELVQKDEKISLHAKSLERKAQAGIRPADEETRSLTDLLVKKQRAVERITGLYY